jgi:2-aminoadipate aminotransferase (EC 2.6.1.39)
MDLPKLLAERTAYMRASEIRELLKWATADVISFGGGMPDPSTFPLEEIARISSYVLETYGGKALQYGQTEGVPELRDELAKFATSNGIRATADNVIVTVGSQEALELLGRLFLDEKSVVVAENPTYIAALQSWRVYRPRLVGIPMDDSGMRTEVLEEQVRRLKAEGARIKFIYTVPTAQNPHRCHHGRRQEEAPAGDSGAERPTGGRGRPLWILRIRQHKRHKAEGVGQVGEGDIPLDRIQDIQPRPQARLGGGRPGAHQVVRPGEAGAEPQHADAQPISTARGLRRGVIQRNIPKIVELYRRKRDAMLAALEAYMPQGVTWTRPSGGMFIWVKVPEKIDTREMLGTAIAKYKVAYVPGMAFT